MTYGCPWERTVGGEWTHVYVWLSSFAVHLKPPQHCKLAIPQYKMNFRVWITTTQVIFRMEKETATHSSVLAWIISGTGKPSGMLSMGSHGVGHDWSDLAAAASLEGRIEKWLQIPMASSVFLVIHSWQLNNLTELISFVKDRSHSLIHWKTDKMSS